MTLEQRFKRWLERHSGDASLRDAFAAGYHEAKCLHKPGRVAVDKANSIINKYQTVRKLNEEIKLRSKELDELTNKHQKEWAKLVKEFGGNFYEAK